MKTIIVALALVGALASQASAQTAQQERSGVRQQRVVVQPTGRRHAPNPSQDVYAPDGTYVGSDPDPFIRDSMWFDSALQGND